MNNKILRKYKIDERYVLSERKFLYTFGYLCLEQDLIENKGLNKKQLYYFLEQKLENASEEEIDLANVATGKIILVGRPNSFRAYRRPIIVDDVVFKRSHKEKVKYSEKNLIGNLSYSELIKNYYDNIDNDKSFLYLEEFLTRINYGKHQEKEELAKCSENKIKSYKKNLRA